ncbi:TauD/TfdA family dioxygenase [Kitasatospora sp. NPDC088160]|uniref:TauD/TfdA family dioxygenase n=1 Tax=Kitasatospora sp. NPDC088160 TaxID=3364072 RepID=UPI003806C4E2
MSSFDIAAAPSRPDPADGVFLDLPGELEEALVEIGGTLPTSTMDGTFLAASTIERYRTGLAPVQQFAETMAALRAKLSTAGAGRAVVRLGNVAPALGEVQFLRLVTAILAEVAVPFQPLQRYELWKPIGTQPGKDPNMTSGTGYQAHHIDLVNATMPPDYTALLCERPDPLGGGASIVSDARAAVERLTKTSRDLLAEPVFTYGRFFELSDVGEEFRPFPVLDGEPHDRGFVRFTGKMLTRSGMDEPHANAARELAAQLIAGQEVFTLKGGDLLFLNHHRVLHGRQALGEGQHDVAPDDRRRLLQAFLRDSGRPS